MKVYELIELLKQMPQDVHVELVDDAGYHSIGVNVSVCNDNDDRKYVAISGY